MHSISKKKSSKIKSPSGRTCEEEKNVPGRSSMGSSDNSEFISDETEECDQEETGIKVAYVLKKEEIYECLKTAGTLKTSGKLYIFINSVFTALAIAFLIYGKIAGKASFFLLAAVFVSFIVLFGIFPIRINHIRAESSADGHKICMRIYPKHIEVGRGVNKLNIPLDGTAESAEVDNMIVLILNNEDGRKEKKESKMVILPLRCLDPVLLPDVQTAVFSGTKPRKIRI